jgi:polyisoprenyl-phosphate glycosyltransferase
MSLLPEGEGAIPDSTTNSGHAPDISLIVPVLNEELSIRPFIERTASVLEQAGLSWDVVFVNDGSTDGTLREIREARARYPQIRALDLSRNFGKEIALSAGLDHAHGRAVVPLDVDLQDPPELIPDMVALWRQGFEIVQARRDDRSSDSWFKRHSADLFYSLISRLSPLPIPRHVGDFRLLDAKVVQTLRLYRERERFMKGIFASVGFKTATVDYARPERAIGRSRFSVLKLAQLSIEGITSFSVLPLKIWTYIGLLVALASLGYAAVIAIRTLYTGVEVPGYASIVVFLLFLNGLTLIGLGVLGEYLARVFSEVKARPLYIIREEIGPGPDASPKATA